MHQYMSNVHLRLGLITVKKENVSIFMAKHLNDGLENKIGHFFYRLHSFAFFPLVLIHIRRSFSTHLVVGISLRLEWSALSINNNNAKFI